MGEGQSTHQEDVLARYQQTSSVQITQNQFHGGIQVVLENGKRLWFSSRIKWSDLGATPYIEIAFPDREGTPGFGVGSASPTPR